MSERYDAIVVGAGLGGLSAAALLAREGKRVLLCEKHNIPGGYATSFVRGRYEFEVALHELSGIGTAEKRGHLYRYLERLGVTDDVTFLDIPELYRSVFPDQDLVLPRGAEAYEETLARAFPSDAAGIRAFLKLVLTVAREVAAIAAVGRMTNPLKTLVQCPHTVRHFSATWGEVLRGYVSGARARAVLSQYWGYFGLPPSEVSFIYFAVALASYLVLGPSYVKGRSQALSNAFVRVVERHGGRVRFHCGVRRITVAGGRVTGVVTDTGEAYEADWTISNADPIATCHDLIGLEHVPEAFIRSLRASTVAASTVNVYLGVARPAAALGLTCHENFVNDDDDFDAQGAAMATLGPPRCTLTTCYNAVDPDVSPPGTCAVVLTTLSMGDPWCRLSPQGYHEAKQRIADAMIRAAERIAPGLRAAIETVDVATPITNMRYAHTLGGSIYGFANPPHDHTVLRMRQRGPLPGLLFVGAWTQMGGGFEPCMLSGATAAEIVLNARPARPVEA